MVGSPDPLPPYRLEKVFDVRRRTGFLRRERRQVRAVDRLSFTVGRGEMVGYIGPNGAGKSTTIKMLTGILVPSSGHLHVAGLEPSRRRAELARRIGVVFGQRTTLWWDLPLRESFTILAAIHRLDDREARQRTEEELRLQPLAGRCQRNVPAGALEQLDAEGLLELTDPLRQWRGTPACASDASRC